MQDGPEAAPGEWLSVEAAARRLGVSPRAVRNRIKRGALEWRLAGNHGREVFVPDGVEAAPDDPGTDPETVELMVQVARLEERLAGVERDRDGSRDRAKRAEARADRLEAELRKPWWRRLWG